MASNTKNDCFVEHYTVLGVPRNATDDEITRRHRKLCMEYHPDRHPDPAEQLRNLPRMQAVNNAKDVLIDSKTRNAHDRELQNMANAAARAASQANVRPTFTAKNWAQPARDKGHSAREEAARREERARMDAEAEQNRQNAFKTRTPTSETLNAFFAEHHKGPDAGKPSASTKVHEGFGSSTSSRPQPQYTSSTGRSSFASTFGSNFSGNGFNVPRASRPEFTRAPPSSSAFADTTFTPVAGTKSSKKPKPASEAFDRKPPEWTFQPFQRVKNVVNNVLNRNEKEASSSSLPVPAPASSQTASTASTPSASAGSSSSTQPSSTPKTSSGFTMPQPQKPSFAGTPPPPRPSAGQNFGFGHSHHASSNAQSSSARAFQPTTASLFGGPAKPFTGWGAGTSTPLFGGSAYTTSTSFTSSSTYSSQSSFGSSPLSGFGASSQSSFNSSTSSSFGSSTQSSFGPPTPFSGFGASAWSASPPSHTPSFRSSSAHGHGAFQFSRPPPPAPQQPTVPNYRSHFDLPGMPQKETTFKSSFPWNHKATPKSSGEGLNANDIKDKLSKDEEEYGSSDDEEEIEEVNWNKSQKTPKKAKEEHGKKDEKGKGKKRERSEDPEVKPPSPKRQKAEGEANMANAPSTSESQDTTTPETSRSSKKQSRDEEDDVAEDKSATKKTKTDGDHKDIGTAEVADDDVHGHSDEDIVDGPSATMGMSAEQAEEEATKFKADMEALAKEEAAKKFAEQLKASAKAAKEAKSSSFPTPLMLGRKDWGFGWGSNISADAAAKSIPVTMPWNTSAAAAPQIPSASSGSSGSTSRGFSRFFTAVFSGFGASPVPATSSSSSTPGAGAENKRKRTQHEDDADDAAELENLRSKKRAKDGSDDDDKEAEWETTDEEEL